jgi:hypothetical protein
VCGEHQFPNEVELSQFYVDSHKMEAEKNGSEIIFEVKLKRIYSYHLTNTFLPTSTLLLIAEVTLHFEESKMELAIGLSLTVLLVTYTMYQSISESLTKTAYLKMIDYWLLFCLLVPFITFMVEIYLFLQKNDANLKESSEGWVKDEKEIEKRLLKRRKQFQYIVYCSTLLFLSLYFIISLLMFQEVL